MENLDRERLKKGIELLDKYRLTLLYALSTDGMFRYLLTGDEEEIMKIRKEYDLNV